MEEKQHPQFKLLEFLEQTGITKECNISKFIVVHFDKPTKKTSNDEDKAVQFLQSMQRRELIRYDRGQLDNVNNRYISANPTTSELPMWFDNEIVMCNITMGGLEYLFQYKMNQSIILSNDIISENSKTQTSYIRNQTFILLGTAIFALAALCVSGINLYRDIQKDKSHQQSKEKYLQINTLQREKLKSVNDTFLRKEAKKTSTKKK